MNQASKQSSKVFQIHPLEHMRLKLGLSYEEVAEGIFHETGIRRGADCWRKIATGFTKAPHRTTDFAMQQYLASLNIMQKVAAR
jgi:hypothetical protein